MIWRDDDGLDWEWIGFTLAWTGTVLLWLWLLPFVVIRLEEHFTNQRLIATLEHCNARILKHATGQAPVVYATGRVRVNVGGIVVSGERMP